MSAHDDRLDDTLAALHAAALDGLQSALDTLDRLGEMKGGTPLREDPGRRDRATPREVGKLPA
jgi:hypothetical protein